MKKRRDKGKMEKKQEEIRRFLIEAGETSLRDRPSGGAVSARPAPRFIGQYSSTSPLAPRIHG